MIYALQVRQGDKSTEEVYATDGRSTPDGLNALPKDYNGPVLGPPLRLKRLYDAIEAGVADLDDPALKERIAGLKIIRDQSRVDTDRAQAMLESIGERAITPEMVGRLSEAARERMRPDGGGYRRDHLRALAQRVEVGDDEVRIMGSKSDLLRTLVAAEGGKSAGVGVPARVLKWRSGRDSNPRYAFDVYSLSRRAPSTTRPPLRMSRKWRA